MRRLLLLIMVSFIGVSCASTTRLRLAPAMVAISVGDLEAMSCWYREQLGFTTRASLSWPEHGVRTEVLHVEGFDLELIARSGSQPLSAFLSDPDDPTLLRGIKKFALVTPRLEETFRILKASGVTFVYPVIQLTRLGQRYFMIEDPEGNIIQFFESRTF